MVNYWRKSKTCVLNVKRHFHIIIIIYFIWLESRSRLGRPRWWLWRELCVCGHNVEVKDSLSPLYCGASSLKAFWFSLYSPVVLSLTTDKKSRCDIKFVKWFVRKNRDPDVGMWRRENQENSDCTHVLPGEGIKILKIFITTDIWYSYSYVWTYFLQYTF
jgi:hypothetical protein